MASDSSLPNASFRGFRDPIFGRYLAMRFLISIATGMQATAVGWQVYDLTGDPVALGFVGLAQFAPIIPLMPVSGQVADREITASYDDLDALSRFAQGVSVVTLEFENVPAAAAAAAATSTP